MKSDERVLAVDCGTQSLKALVFDTSGQLLAKAQVAFEPYFSTRPGWAEQDPQVFWEALCRACHMLWQEKGVAKKDIVAMSLTTQRSTVINVDQEGSPLRPAIVWMDQRKTHGLPPVGGLWGIGFKIIGQSETVDYLRAEAEANWIATYQADIWDQTHKFLLLSGYLTYRLTGEFVDSVAAQVGYLPFDFRRHRWAANWNWKWRILPLRRSMLPDLQPPGNLLGHISGSAADQTGLPPGLPLIAAAADKACEVISITPSRHTH